MTSGGVLAAALLWALGAALGRRGATRWRYAVATVPLAAALVLTQTRSHWLGAAFGAVTIFIALAPRAWWTVPVAAVLIGRFAPARIVARLASIVDPHEPGNQGRLSMWRSGGDIIRAHPVIGVGCQDLLALYRRYRYPDWTFESGHFHNNFVQLAVSTGALGVAAFVYWLVAAFRELSRALRSALGGADRGLVAAGLGVMVAMLVSGMFDYTFGDAEVIEHSYLALGFALAVRSSAAGGERAAAGASGPGRATGGGA
jgi:O-antigen ligase